MTVVRQCICKHQENSVLSTKSFILLNMTSDVSTKKLISTTTTYFIYREESSELLLIPKRRDTLAVHVVDPSALPT